MQFLTGEPLAEEIYDIIYKAEKELIIISPYISLDSYFKDKVFKTHLNNSEIHIIIGFGKNEENISNSVKQQDIEFFTQFPNISIVYIKDLHGKYYCNEKKAISTSMNLIDYSFINNIEFGTLGEKRLINNNGFYETSKKIILDILEEMGDTVFVKRPKYRKKLLFGKDYRGSDIKLDKISEMTIDSVGKRTRLSKFNSEFYVNSALKEDREKRNHVLKHRNNLQRNPKVLINDTEEGFCIRCKKSIPKNTEKPLCYDDYKTWEIYSDIYYAERYCHSCGKEHETSFAKPECKKCFVKNKGVKTSG